MAKRKAKSRMSEAVHEGARDLYKAGFIDKRRMLEFDALCLEPVPTYSKSKIRALRDRHNISQAVLAAVRIASVIHGVATVMDAESVSAALPAGETMPA